ncbi:MAG: phosphoenolpyruvate carboxykinase (GTP) [Thermoplasmataceae archaeon]
MEKEKLKSVEEWVESVADLVTPERVVFCDGTEKEYKSIIGEMLSKEELIELNQDSYPDCYLFRSDPRDVARTEKATYIVARESRQIGPLNNYMSLEKSNIVIDQLLKNSMKGRTMYVIPYIMGPEDSPYAEVGIEITDSPYVVVNMYIMTRMGHVALEKIAERGNYIRSIHASRDLDPDDRYILHFPWERPNVDAHVISINSAYGGNALLSKKCHALRIASVEAYQQGWMAEHMLILEVQNPEGRKYYFLAAFPSASGKTNLAMINPPVEYAKKGWKTRLIGDDIAWIHIGKDGYLYAMNPENGFFGVVPGTNSKTNPNAMKSISHDTIFTNVALTDKREPWWEGLPDPAGEIIDWQGRKFNRAKGAKAAHPNSRFTTPLSNYPDLSSEVNNPEGVPVTGIIFGGRRGDTVPLVYQAFDWDHGVFLGATMGVEQTAAAEGTVGEVRRDPMAMRPFCGYNISDYFRHWIEIGSKASHLPGIFYVNWFRRDSNGSFIWPGFGENLRVIEWMINRQENRTGAIRTEIGYIPDGDFNLDGLDLPEDHRKLLFKIDRNEWKKEVSEIGAYLDSLGPELPEKIRKEYTELRNRFKFS